LDEGQTSCKLMMGSSNRRAFTGSIIEHDDGLTLIHPQESTHADQATISHSNILYLSYL
jgi:hypothetical protein